MLRFLPSALAGCALALCLPVLHADTLDQFTMVSALHTISFTLPSSPTPSALNDACVSQLPPEFCLENVSVTMDGVTATDTLEFFSAEVGGGLNLVDTGIDQIGWMLYAGPESAPTFVPGVYPLINAGGGRVDAGDFVLTITELTEPPAEPPTSTVPEPSSFLLLGSGLLGGVRLLRRRTR